MTETTHSNMSKAVHMRQHMSVARSQMISGLANGASALALTYALMAVPLAFSLPAHATAAKGAKAAAAKPAPQNAAEQAPASGRAKDPAIAQRAFAEGSKAFEAGNYTKAIGPLSEALANGGLPNSQMAKAMYYRGAAYRQLGKPSQAISDLTTAIWLKGGLTGADKDRAAEERQIAYREAGLGDMAPAIGTPPLDAPKATPTQKVATASAPAAAPAAPQPKPGVLVATVPPANSIWNGVSLPSVSLPSLPTFSIPGLSSAPQTAETQQPAATSVQTAQASGAAVAMSSWDSATAVTPATTASAPAPGLTADPQPQQVAAVSSGQTTSTLGGIFGGLFGTSATAQQATSTPSSPIATGSTQAAPWSDTTVTPTNAQTSSMVQRGPEGTTPQESEASPAGAWATETKAGKVATATRPALTKVAAVGSGRFNIQVAAVRSRAEAKQIVQSLNNQPAIASGAARPQVDETVIGSMGTFYRVRLGPYANNAESTNVCKALKPQGFDCMVTTN